MITSETRQKFRNWSSALDKLTVKEKEEEAEAWINSALKILDEDELEKEEIKKPNKEEENETV